MKRTIKRWMSGALCGVLAVVLTLSAQAMAVQTKEIWRAQGDARLVDLNNEQDYPAFGDMGAWVGILTGDTEDLQKRSLGYKQGEAFPLKSIVLKEPVEVRIESELCGVLVRGVPGEEVKVSFYGEEPDAFILTSEQAGGILKLSLRGSSAQARYLNTGEERLFNTFVVELPQKLCKQLVLDEGLGVVRVDSPAYPVNGKTQQGKIWVTGDVTSTIDLDAGRGWATVAAGTVSAPVKLSADQGWASLQARDITVPVELYAAQGWATLTADSTDRVSVRADQGWATAELGALSARENVEVIADQGWATLTLRERPKEMRLTLDGPFQEVGESLSGFTMQGNNSYVAGTGGPLVTLKGAWVNFSIK